MSKSQSSEAFACDGASAATAGLSGFSAVAKLIHRKKQNTELLVKNTIGSSGE